MKYLVVLTLLAVTMCGGCGESSPPLPSSLCASISTFASEVRDSSKLGFSSIDMRTYEKLLDEFNETLDTFQDSLGEAEYTRIRSQAYRAWNAALGEQTSIMAQSLINLTMRCK